MAGRHLRENGRSTYKQIFERGRHCSKKRFTDIDGIQVPCEVVGPSNDQGKFPARMSSEFAVGKPRRVRTVFSSTTEDIISDFSFEHFIRMDDCLLLESIKRPLNATS